MPGHSTESTSFGIPLLTRLGAGAQSPETFISTGRKLQGALGRGQTEESPPWNLLRLVKSYVFHFMTYPPAWGKTLF